MPLNAVCPLHRNPPGWRASWECLSPKELTRMKSSATSSPVCSAADVWLSCHPSGPRLQETLCMGSRDRVRLESSILWVQCLVCARFVVLQYCSMAHFFVENRDLVCSYLKMKNSHALTLQRPTTVPHCLATIGHCPTPICTCSLRSLYQFPVDPRPIGFSAGPVDLSFSFSLLIKQTVSGASVSVPVCGVIAESVNSDTPLFRFS